MKYQVIASPIKGQTINKTVEGVRELHDYLGECREMGYDVKTVKRRRQSVVQLSREPLAI